MRVIWEMNKFAYKFFFSYFFFFFSFSCNLSVNYFLVRPVYTSKFHMGICSYSLI